MVKLAILAHVEAKPGKEDAVARFFSNALPLVEAEPRTVAWFGFRTGPSTFAIFDTFEDEAGRDAHLNGEVAKALMAVADDLFARPPVIEKADLLGVKMPG